MLVLSPDYDFLSGDYFEIIPYNDSYYIDNKMKDGDYILIIKDSSICLFDLEETIRSIVNSIQFDVLYLHKYLDLCYTYDNPQFVNKKGLKIYETKGPKGSQSMILSNKAVKYLIRKGSNIGTDSCNALNEGIKSHKLIGKATHPNIIEYDIDKANDVTDYYKTMSCVTPAPKKSQTEYTVIFFIVLLISLIIGYIYTLYI
jgi:hypothetical protein